MIQNNEHAIGMRYCIVIAVLCGRHMRVTRDGQATPTGHVFVLLESRFQHYGRCTIRVCVCLALQTGIICLVELAE